MNIYEEWIQAKETEKLAVDRRRQIEDEIIDMFNLPDDVEGAVTVNDRGFSIKAVIRVNRSVNSEMVQELAVENGTTEHLSSLFRWKPEINMKAWKDAGESITKPLAMAITAKPGRPSFTITKEEK